MANFIRQGYGWYRLHIGDIVEGKNGHKTYIGRVLESTKKKGKPAVFQRWGFVGCWIETDTGRKVVVNEIRPIERAKDNFVYDEILERILQ